MHKEHTFYLERAQPYPASQSLPRGTSISFVHLPCHSHFSYLLLTATVDSVNLFSIAWIYRYLNDCWVQMVLRPASRRTEGARLRRFRQSKPKLETILKNKPSAKQFQKNNPFCVARRGGAVEVCASPGGVAKQIVRRHPGWRGTKACVARGSGEAH
jgi:hypothetical protein